ncbi:hypothetical protein R1flu_028555 [Riccia fluitans]|uniref:Uncharacterized protein n=1 Tax=Riccia fluitans TaxID=41844 RepID=A0ABD1XM04_9MARC
MTSVSQPKSETNHDEKSVKVMVLRSRTLKRVLYLECGNDFADILLSLLIMPVGAILGVLKEAGLAKRMDKGLCKLYASLQELENSTFCIDKSALIDPSKPLKSSGFLHITAAFRYTCVIPDCRNPTLYSNQLCNGCSFGAVDFKCTRCNYKNSTSVNNRTHCSMCHTAVEKTVCVGSKPPGKTTGGSSATGGNEDYTGEGFLRENVTFIIKEDLTIMKSSTISSMSLLKSWKVDSFQDLDIKEIVVG